MFAVPRPVLVGVQPGRRLKSSRVATHRQYTAYGPTPSASRQGVVIYGCNAGHAPKGGLRDDSTVTVSDDMDPGPLR